MIIDLVELLEFIRAHFVSILFSIVLVCLIVFLIRLNSANGPYKHFRLAHLVMRLDGKLDRRAFRETVLFLVSIYGFLYVLQKHQDLLVGYFWALASIWLGAHIAAEKIPTLGGPPKPPEKKD